MFYFKKHYRIEYTSIREAFCFFPKNGNKMGFFKGGASGLLDFLYVLLLMILPSSILPENNAL